MPITFTLNGQPVTTRVTAHERLLRMVRRLGCYSVKFGDEHGLTGADTVLFDGAPINSQTMLAAQADGHTVLTLRLRRPQRVARDSSRDHSERSERPANGALWASFRSRAALSQLKNTSSEACRQCEGAPDSSAG